MIISASYKTDIPTFYGEWFMNRLAAGYCKVINPYSRRAYRVSLERGDVEGIVFWTKNAGPFLSRLADVHRMGFPFVVQHTINGFPRVLEARVVDWKRCVANVATIRSQFGPRVVVWRYDTILFSSLTPYSFHAENFGMLAHALRGITDEVVISFAQIYRKTRRNLDTAAARAGFKWWDPEPAEKRQLTSDLLKIASQYGIRLTVCSQRELVVTGAAEARCVDARRIEDAGGAAVSSRLRGNRKECGCFESRDIGDYDTCPHGCVYCYAVQNPDLALARYRRHDPNSEFLFQPDGDLNEPRGDPPAGGPTEPQLRLFGPK